MNLVALIGRLTAEPELKTTQSGVSVTSFTIAVDRSYTPKGEEKQADFIRCVAWRNTAEFVTRYFHKGNKIAVKGELQQRNYTAKDGSKRSELEVIIDDAFFCEGKTAQSAAPQSVPSVPVDNSVNIDIDGDLPF